MDVHKIVGKATFVTLVSTSGRAVGLELLLGDSWPLSNTRYTQGEGTNVTQRCFYG